MVSTVPSLPASSSLTKYYFSDLMSKFGAQNIGTQDPSPPGVLSDGGDARAAIRVQDTHTLTYPVTLTGGGLFLSQA